MASFVDLLALYADGFAKPDQFFKAFHDDWCKCFWTVVIQGAHSRFLWDWNNVVWNTPGCDSNVVGPLGLLCPGKGAEICFVGQ